MLTGTIKVKLLSGKYYTYFFEGEDTPASLIGTITSSSYDALQLMAGDLDDSNAANERHIEIKSNSVKVSRVRYQDENGKFKNYGINDEFFLKLAALIRYAKTRCNTMTLDGDLGLANASGEFVAEPVKRYVIPAGATGDTLGVIELAMGSMKSCHLENDSFIISLDEDGSLPSGVFKGIKNSTPKGFLFTKDYLDFVPETGHTGYGTSGLYETFGDVIAAHPEKELEWLRDKKYTIVKDEMLDELFEEFMSHEGYVYYDTETTGLNINFKSRTGEADQCVGIVLSKDDGVSYYFPMQMKFIKNLCGGDHFYFMEKYMKPILESKPLVAHNMSFDWKVAYIYDIDANIVDDTLAMIALTYSSEKEGYPIGLKDATKLILGRDSLELSDLVMDNSWGEGMFEFWDLPEELVKFYACADTDNTRGIHRHFIDNDILQKYNAKRVYEIEIAFSLAVAYQEFYGHMVDVSNIEKLKAEINAQISEEMSKMVEIVGHDFNPNSSPQLIKIMYEELGIPQQISRKTGRPTTDKSTLKDLAKRTDADGKPLYPFVNHLVEFRLAEGVRKIVNQYDEQATTDGFLFSQVMQYGTNTGRVSIHKPNYQSYNDAVKKYVIPRPGFYMFDTDYSSVEYRVLANMAGNESIKNGFIDPDFDYHTYQAARMYNVPYATVTKALRSAAKGINFGLPYGMGDESLGAVVFGAPTPENTVKAAKLREKYFIGQEDIKEFFERVRTGGVRNGFTETYFGRRRYYRRSKFTESAIRRQAGNAVIQGTAADIYKLAVGRVFARIRKEGWLGKVLLSGFIHDELSGEVHNSIDPMKFLKILREEFEVSINNWCPLYMGFGFGMSWYAAKKTEIPIQLQWEMVEKWGDTGYDRWNHDGHALYSDVLDMLRDFSVRHCANQITSSEAQGKEIKPATNSALIDVCKTDVDIYVSAVKKCLSDAGVNFKHRESDFYSDSKFVKACGVMGINHEDVLSGAVDAETISKIFKKSTISLDFTPKEIEEGCQDVLRSCIDALSDAVRSEYIQRGTVVDDSGRVIVDLFSYFNTDINGGVIETQSALDFFCQMHCIDRNSVDVKSIDAAVASEESESTVSVGHLSFDEDENDSYEQRLASIDARVRQLGMYLDTENGEVILKMIPKEWLALVKQQSSDKSNGYRIRFRDFDAGKDYITEAYIPYANISAVQQIYIRYMSLQTV